MNRKLLVSVASSALVAMCLSVVPLGSAATAAMSSGGPLASVRSTNSTALADEPRVLFNDDFSANDGAKWIATTANPTAQVLFSSGRATIKGGGPENRMVSRNEILADNFTLDLDLFINAGNTNSAIKVGFLATESAGFRYQVTYDGPKKVLRLERQDGSTTTVIGAPASADLAVNTDGAPHKISISVHGQQVQLRVGGELKLTATDAGITQATAGRVMFASQFPNQDFSVDNIRVTTTEPEQVGDYKVELATETNMVRDSDAETAGGTLVANRDSGMLGDVVTLSYTVKPGYVFAGYDSRVLETDTSTDGLLTITDNRFSFNDKTGSVLIIAKFVTEPNDPNVVFKDYFAGTLNEHGQYQLSNPTAGAIVNGELELTATEGASYALVDGTSWASPVNYRVELDVRKGNSVPGTAQIAFRANGFANRYVVTLNGSKAMLRRLDSDGSNVELASALFAFDQSGARILIDVSGDTVSVSADGKPLFSYKNRDDGDKDHANFSATPPALAMINMTPGAPVAFDNVKVTKTPVYLKAKVEVRNAGEADPQQASGAVVLSAYTTAAGQTLSWSSYPKGGYVFTGMSYQGAPITGNQFVVPAAGVADITLQAHFEPQETTGQTYYIDSLAGDDSRSGTAPEQAWASLAKVKRGFNPGDQILLKRGSTFAGKAAELVFTGSGTAQHPILVGAYGEGNRPTLNGAGALENVISLFNQEYVEVSGLEITNLDPAFNGSFGLNKSSNTEKNLRAVNVSARDFGVVRGITIKDLFIHDINGNLNAKWNGGIFFDVAATINNGEILGVPTKFDHVLVAGNKLERVDRSGIKLVSSAWSNQSLVNSPSTPLNWYPSTNVVVRDNQIRYMGGDAITVRDTDGALLEYNLVQHSRYQNTGYNAGIWPFQTTNTVIQYNEVSTTHGVQDGQGLDVDHVSAYSVMQYNYSHNNEGGFMLIMNGFPHTAPTIRYNISQNDADKSFEFARGTPAGTMIHNNTISSDTTLQGPRGGVLDLANSAAGTGNREAFIFNNVFNFPAGQKFYVGEADTMKTKAKLINNAYTGGISVPAEEENAIVADLGLSGLGTAPVASDGATAPLTGPNVGDHFAGYVPSADSALRNQGLSIEELVAHYGGTVTDRSELSPTQIHALALAGKSIDFVAGHNLPTIAGVGYDTDFLGNPLPDSALSAANKSLSVESNESAEGITVGAIQFQPQATEPTPTPEVTSTPEETTPVETTTPGEATTPTVTVKPSSPEAEDGPAASESSAAGQVSGELSGGQADLAATGANSGMLLGFSGFAALLLMLGMAGLARARNLSNARH